MIPESMCDRCMSPGACCKRINLSGGAPGNASSEFERAVGDIGEPMSHERTEHRALELGLWMFQPAHQREDGRWSWACSQLLPNGRCGIYEDRPDLCRRYGPGQDGLCVHFWEKEREGVSV